LIDVAIDIEWHHSTDGAGQRVEKRCAAAKKTVYKSSTKLLTARDSENEGIKTSMDQ
jgi:hypothetical protein